MYIYKCRFEIKFITNSGCIIDYQCVRREEKLDLISLSLKMCMHSI